MIAQYFSLLGYLCSLGAFLLFFCGLMLFFAESKSDRFSRVHFSLREGGGALAAFQVFDADEIAGGRAVWRSLACGVFR